MRVEASKKRLIWVRPRKVARFFSTWREIATASSERSRSATISSRERCSTPSRWRWAKTGGSERAMAAATFGLGARVWQASPGPARRRNMCRDTAGTRRLSGAALANSVIEERNFISSTGPKICRAVRPSTLNVRAAHSRSLGPRTGCDRNAEASSREEIANLTAVGLCPRPAICGKTNHIQWVSFRPARSSPQTAGRRGPARRRIVAGRNGRSRSARLIRPSDSPRRARPPRPPRASLRTASISARMPS